MTQSSLTFYFDVFRNDFTQMNFQNIFFIKCFQATALVGGAVRLLPTGLRCIIYHVPMFMDGDLPDSTHYNALVEWNDCSDKPARLRFSVRICQTQPTLLTLIIITQLFRSSEAHIYSILQLRYLLADQHHHLMKSS